MNTIKKRIITLFVFCISLVSALGLLTFFSFQNYASLYNEYDQSYALIDSALALKARQTPTIAVEELLKIAATLNPEFRSNALSRVIKHPSHDNVNFLIKAESEYRKYLTPLLQYFKKRTEYFGAMALSASALFILGLFYFIFVQMFFPLKDLSVKMVDFLNNRYSYKFTVPSQDEIGQLHSTFNTMAQKVLTQIEELQSLDKAKSEFLSIASHELRTPLTSIKGSLSLLNSGVVGKMAPATQNLMVIALDETDRLIRLINELLDLAKIEARQFPLSCNWVSAQNLIDTTFKSLQGFCQATNIKLNAVDTHDVELNVDADRIQQVLTNLLSNAIKYSPTNGVVTVKFIADEHQQMRIEVTDCGHGIAPEDQEIIFEKFRQATSAQNPLVKGTGLGLAIAKALVEQHGGAIGVRSTHGQGSTFYFTLPKWQRHLGAGGAASSGAASGGTASRRVAS